MLIHDAARPFCTPDLIAAVLDPLAQVEGCDAISPVPRDRLWRAQTLQAVRYAAIRAAHASGDTNAADDVEIVRTAGLSVRVVEGDEANFKITLPRDLERADQILLTRRPIIPRS
ncbi:MAG: 2-C-methyl-D-erythritol 4-phosphate cytidylyltransferase [Pelagibaca sp.]